MKKFILVQIAIACLLLSPASYAQITNLTNNSTILPVEFVGWGPAGVVAKPLDINNSFLGKPINFFTGGIAIANQRMIILGNGIPNAGFVGIGASFVTPAFLLDVEKGDINIGQTGTSDQFGYRIGHKYVLWHNSDGSSIMVGVNAGNAAMLAFGAFNDTYVGARSGFSTTTGFSNTFCGNNSGTNTTSGIFNTFIGAAAGLSNVNGSNNCFFSPCWCSFS